MGAHPEPPPQVRTRPRRPGRGLLSTSLYGNFHLPTVQGRVPPTRCALLSREPQDSPFRRVPTWKCWGQGKGGPSGESCKCGVWQGSPAGSAPSLRPGPAPPLRRSCWRGVNIPGWVSETCAPPRYPAPWRDGPAPAGHRSQTFSNPPPPVPPNRPGSRLCRQLTPLSASPAAPGPPPHAAQGRKRGVRPREPAPQPPAARPGAAPTRRPARRLPGSRHRCRPPPCCVLRTEQRALALLPGTPLPAPLWPSRGGRIATGQNGGMAFFGGGDSSDCLGRTGCLRAGAGQMLYFRGGKGIGK